MPKRRLHAYALVTCLAMAPAVSAQTGAATPKFAPTAPAPRPAANDAHRRDDIEKHRQIARAHEAAARCLESGEKEAVCQQRLRDACKGIAVGRFCGMRHAH